MSTHVDDELFDRDELSRRLHGISTEYIRLRCHDGRWPHLKVGRQYLFSEAHYQQILALIEVKPTPTPAQTWGRRTRGARTP